MDVALVVNARLVLLKAFNETDYARWLNMLIRETSSVNGGREPADGIYDEVYNWAIYQPGGGCLHVFVVFTAQILMGKREAPAPGK